jgi:hypothetical protein
MKSIILVAAVVVSAFPSSLLAQSNAGLGGVWGTVLDASSAVIRGVSIRVIDDRRGIRRELTTNEAGIFNVPGLVPSETYEVEADLPGFAPYRLANVRVQVGSNVNLKIVLQVSAATQQVDVGAAAPLVDSDKVDFS